MNADIAQLQPQAVWQWFARICAIPHPTFHEQALAAAIVDAARARGLAAERDAKGNVRICKPGTAGLADRAEVILQAHIDMVPQKGADSSHDFVTDPIRPHIVDGWVYADNTTLGADNGIGVALALAVLFADDVAHPPLSVVLTVEEETGMGGVEALNPAWLQAPWLLNLDTEDAGSLFVGCAGGRDASLSLNLPGQPGPGRFCQVRVGGLRGGHSGIDIDKDRANAVLLLASVLASARGQQPLRLAALQGGSLRNVIPREAEAWVLAVDVADTDKLHAALQSAAQACLQQWQALEPGLHIEVAVAEGEVEAATLEDSVRALDLLAALPNGVVAQSPDFAGVVDTSISLGVVCFEQGRLQLHSLMRSLGEAPKDALSAQLAELAARFGAELTLSGDYPGWQPDPDSALLAKGRQIFSAYYGREPHIEIIHAGLECGILKGKAPHTDMISFGPNIRAAHSPKECVEIATVAESWDLLCAFLAQMPECGPQAA